jgi:hypothetical protein
MLVSGRRDTRRFTKALPSENSGKHPREAKWRPTCAWEGLSALHGVTRPGA